MFHIYAFGKKSKQVLIMTPKQAQTMNEFTQSFFNAQKRFLEENGRSWTPDDPFYFEGRPGLMEDYDKLVTFLNRQHAVRNRIFDLFRVDVSEDPMDDFLVKKF